MHTDLELEIVSRLSSKKHSALVYNSYCSDSLVIQARETVAKKYPGVDLRGVTGLSEPGRTMMSDLIKEYERILLEKYTGIQLLEMLIDEERYESNEMGFKEGKGWHED